jgi:chorismate mutase / prephenate dehydratase
MTRSLNRLRATVDALDARIVRLLNERARYCERIGREKRKIRAAFHDPSREKAVLQRIADLSSGPLGEKAITSIYRRVIAACRALQVRRIGRPSPARDGNRADRK